MNNFKLQPTSIAGWHALVTEAEAQSGVKLAEDLQNYLIITLDAFLKSETLLSSVIAIEFFDSIQLKGKEGCRKLRKIGDRCLLLAGLFPESAYRKNVNPTYFIKIGEQAYQIIAVKYAAKHSEQKLFTQLSDDFTTITDVLSTMRPYQ